MRSPSCSERSSELGSCCRSWDDSSNYSALHFGEVLRTACARLGFSSLRGSISEVDSTEEDKRIASKAVAYVIQSTRRGIIPLCSNVAQLMKSKRRLERIVQSQQMKISRLQKDAHPFGPQALSSSRDRLPEPTDSTLKSRSEQTTAICHGDPPDDSALSPMAVKTESCRNDQLMQINPGSSSADTTLDSDLPAKVEPAGKSKMLVSKEVQVESPCLLMEKTCEDRFMETILLNSRLTEDLGNAWRQIKKLRDCLKSAEEDRCWQQRTEVQQTPQISDLLSPRRSEAQSLCATTVSSKSQCGRDVCHRSTQTSREAQDSPVGGEARFLEDGGTPPGPFENQTPPEHLQSLSHRGNNQKSHSAVFHRDSSLGWSLFPFPMIGCKCTSCLCFFSRHVKGRKHNAKEFKSLLNFQRKKVQVSIQDYIIVNGNQSGTVHYIGHLDDAGTANAVFLGVELDEQSGTHDGVFKGKRYYQCFDNCGHFVPVHEVCYRISRKRRSSTGSIRPSGQSSCNGSRVDLGHQTVIEKKSRSPSEPVPGNERSPRRTNRGSVVRRGQEAGRLGPARGEMQLLAHFLSLFTPNPPFKISTLRAPAAEPT
ncbi:uncharacterized protein LOC136712274 [Amia ocellicauda]|uniref:uncharacterized protein LOC136712274 n=1 Tax=Amia ocellicauda TaxID=2972642 RepID=UPI003464E767